MTTLVGVSVANRTAMALLDTSVNLYAWPFLKVD